MEESDSYILEGKGWDFSQTPIEVTTSKNLSDAAVRLYNLLQWRAGRKGVSWPNEKTTAENLGVSTRTIERATKELVSDNWIRRVRRCGRSSITHIFATREDCLEYDNKSNPTNSSGSDLTFLSSPNDSKLTIEINTAISHEMTGDEKIETKTSTKENEKQPVRKGKHYASSLLLDKQEKKKVTDEVTPRTNTKEVFYPKRIRDAAILFSKLWDVPLPEEGSKEVGKWAGQIRRLYEICSGYNDIDVLDVIAQFKVYDTGRKTRYPIETPGGILPWIYLFLGRYYNKTKEK